MLSHSKATHLALWQPNNDRTKTTSSRKTSRNDGEQTQTGPTDAMSATQQKPRHGLLRRDWANSLPRTTDLPPIASRTAHGKATILSRASSAALQTPAE